ncbi:MAG: PIN domain-containing protein [Actinomycetia bacterium]|nr:PIN domain-containing protein [Actinomycetes bacterium]
MTDLVVDTSALLAYFDSSEPDHDPVDEVITGAGGRLVISPYVVAELDYLVVTRHGVGAGLAVLGELSGGAWELADVGIDDVKRASAIIAKYRDQEIGVADASNVVLAERIRTDVIVTLDHRHFDVLRPATGGRFTVLPR